MAVTKERRRERVNSFCYGTLVITAFILLVSSFISFSSLVFLEVKISRNTVYGSATYGDCILYADYNETTNGSYPLIELGRSNACSFAIYGESVIALFAAIFVVVPCIKAIFGRETGTCDIVVQSVLHGVASVLAFLIGLVLSSGLIDTCRAVSQTQNGTCRELVIPEPDSSSNSTSVSFYLSVKVSEGTAWLGWLMLVINVGLYFAWMQRRRADEIKEPLPKELEGHGQDVEDGSKTANGEPLAEELEKHGQDDDSKTP